MGKAYYRFCIGAMAEHFGKAKETIDNEVNYIHSQLPIGTKIIETKRLLILDGLKVHYVAIFEHPILINDSEIKDLTEYKRDIGVNTETEDDNIEHKIYTFDKNNNLNYDDFINNPYKKEELEYEIHVDGVKEIRK